MMRGLWIGATLAALAAGGVQARCVAAGDLANGVIFAREGAFAGRIEARDGGVFIDYNTSAKGAGDQRQTLFGIYEEQTDTTPPPGDVGTYGQTDVQGFRGAPPEPVAGADWETRIKRRSDGGGAVVPDAPDPEVTRFKARYAFLPEMAVQISGCPYRVIPVEAVFDRPEGAKGQRWLYFADLGFGIETIPLGRQVRQGIAVLKPAP
jgi:hypothetical protein